MICLKRPNELGAIANPAIRVMVAAAFQSLLTDYPGPYDPDTHGWFLILERQSELSQTDPFHGQCSIQTILEEHLYESILQGDGFYEVVIALGDAEAVAVYLPESILTHQQLGEIALLLARDE